MYFLQLDRENDVSYCYARNVKREKKRGGGMKKKREKTTTDVLANCIYSRKLKRRRGFFAMLRLSVYHVCIAQGLKTHPDIGEGQKEPDDNPDKLVRIMKTEPRV